FYTLQQDVRTWWNRFKLFAEQNDINTSYLRNCLASFMDDECLKRFEFRVPKGTTNLFELEKHMVKLFGWQPASQIDAVAEFYNRKQLLGEDYRDFYTNLWNLAKYAYAYTGEFDQSKYDYLVMERFVTGLNEPSVFWRVDAAKPQTCAEAYDLRSVDQTEFRIEQSFIPKRPAQFQTINKQTTENKRLFHFCNKSGHMIADCYARKNQMKNMTLNNPSNVEPSVSNRVINRVMFDESIVGDWEINGRMVNFLFDTGTIKTIIARRIWDECKTPESVQQPLSNILVTCVGNQLVNDCLLGLDVAFKVADVKKCLDSIRQALTKQQMPKMSIKNLVVHLNQHEDPDRENTKTTEQNESHDSEDVEAYKFRDEFSDVFGTDMSSISQTTICGHVIEVTTDKAIKQTPREINFDLGNEVKRQINDSPGLNFEIVTQPMEYESKCEENNDRDLDYNEQSNSSDQSIVEFNKFD
ncbi:unnamed protein product, partial [Brachionus calyciflorus]